MAKGKRKLGGPEVPFPWSASTKLRSGVKANRYLGKGKFSASQIGDLIVIVATGATPNLTTEVSLAKLPILVFPPQYALFFTDIGIGLPAQKPFRVEAHFFSKDDVRNVVVIDATGKHNVPVVQF